MTSTPLGVRCCAKGFMMIDKYGDQTRRHGDILGLELHTLDRRIHATVADMLSGRRGRPCPGWALRMGILFSESPLSRTRMDARDGCRNVALSSAIFHNLEGPEVHALTWE